ncbi:hypothetical protein CPAV1605_7 [seawater metagenome]|uniref:MORN repeat variant n=1 Tax=seawater metagenome TaxID=1561972 RepID=A0A5E8CGZ3_9ZZZZ
MEKLYYDVMVKIFNYLAPEEISKFAITSKRNKIRCQRFLDEYLLRINKNKIFKKYNFTIKEIINNLYFLNNNTYEITKFNINKTVGRIIWEVEKNKIEILYYDDTRIRQIWYRNEKKHRENKPAWIEWYTSGELSFMSWFKDNNPYRLNKPAYISWFKNGSVKKEIWMINYKISRIKGPAYQEWYENNIKKIEKWLINGNPKIKKGIPWKTIWNEKGYKIEDHYGYTISHPNLITYYENGRKKTEQWQTNSGLSRFTGPALIKWDKEGYLEYEGWYYRNIFYRKNRDAQIWWNHKGKITKSEFRFEMKNSYTLVFFYKGFRLMLHELVYILLLIIFIKFYY